jgi:hypothetical protein
MDGFDLYQDGRAILVRSRRGFVHLADAEKDVYPTDVLDKPPGGWAPVLAGFREHKQALMRLLPKSPPDAPPKVFGPGGNMVNVSTGQSGG